jgi:hypothetical protein
VKSAINNQQSKIALPARLIRRSVRRLRQMLRYRRLGLQGVPVLFANSFPKSGTHLLTQVLEGFPNLGPAVICGLPAIVTFEGDTGRARTSGEILHDLHRLLPGDIAYGHLHALPVVQDCLSRPGMAAYFILRDPRDVVVSHVHYVTEMEPDHIHHAYYAQALHSFDERLRVSILGRPDFEVAGKMTPAQDLFPDIRQRFEPYLGWLGCPAVLCLRYEDFTADREATLGQVFDFAVGRGFPAALPRERALEVLAASIDPRRSPTFRSGKTGGWRGQFTPEHKRLFKDVAGDLLVQLGYETDNDW